jgi:hypothetical protein
MEDTRNRTAALLAALMLGACSSGDGAATTIPTTAPVSPLPSTSTTSEPTDVIRGSFSIVNTGDAEVGIEDVRVALEIENGDQWVELVADCFVAPEAPIVIKAEQLFDFECTTDEGQSDSGRRRAVAIADIFGLDEPYLQEIELPGS